MFFIENPPEKPYRFPRGRLFWTKYYFPSLLPVLVTHALLQSGPIPRAFSSHVRAVHLSGVKPSLRRWQRLAGKELGHSLWRFMIFLGRSLLTLEFSHDTLTFELYNFNMEGLSFSTLLVTLSNTICTAPQGKSHSLFQLSGKPLNGLLETYTLGLSEHKISYVCLTFKWACCRDTQPSRY